MPPRRRNEKAGTRDSALHVYVVFSCLPLEPRQCRTTLPTQVIMLGIFSSVREARYFTGLVSGRKHVERLPLAAISTYIDLASTLRLRRHIQRMACVCSACFRERAELKLGPPIA